MELIEALRREHDLIEQVLGSLRAFVAARLNGKGDPSDGARFMAFFRNYAGTFHHHKEEAVFFRALAERAELPAERGPIAALTGEHRHLERLLDNLEPLVGLAELTPSDAALLEDLAKTYSRALWQHIDAENSVVFPEGQERLRRAHVYELPSRPMTGLEQDAHAFGTALVVTYPPQHDAEAIRGGGCVLCPSYGNTCNGLEMEWWTDLEWEETWERSDGD